MILLIDGDLIAWRTATSIPAGNNPYVLYERINYLLDSIFNALNTDSYLIYISDKTNTSYRSLINPTYKANRKDIVRPEALDVCFEYLTNYWRAISIPYYEADDALGWNQTENTIICTIDKDLDMIPGKHYNFVRHKEYEVSNLDAIQFFYKQMLIGDNADNIKGIYQIGPKKAAKLIDPLTEEQEMFDLVYNKYNDPKRFLINAECLWIQQERGTTWVNRQKLCFPSPLQQEQVRLLDYMTSLRAGI